MDYGTTVNRPRLLVFEQRMMGDAVMSLPFIRAAQSQFDIHIACAPATASIFNLVLPTDHIHRWHPPWLEGHGGQQQPSWIHSGLNNYLCSLKKLSPACAVSVWADLRVHFLMARCGAATRIGFPMTEQNYYANHLPWRKRQLRLGRILSGTGALLNGSPQLTHPLFRQRDDQHHVDCWRQVAEALNLPWDESTPWFRPAPTQLPESAESAISAARRTGSPVWLVHAGARVPAQRWPLEYFGEMAREEIAAAGAQGILIDSPEVQWPEAMREEFPIVQAKALDQLIALLNACDGLLCNDTGVSHLAAALGKSVVALFLASNPSWFGPRGSQCRWVASEGCPLCPCMGRCLQPRWLCHDPDLRPQVRAALRERIFSQQNH